MIDAFEIKQSPFLYFEQDEWDNLKDKLEDPFFQKMYENNLKALELLEKHCGKTLMDVPHYLDRPEDKYTGRLPRVMRNRIKRNVVAYYVSSEQTYLDMAIEVLDACCEIEWFLPRKNAGLHGGNLHTSDFIYVVSFGLDALWNHLTDEQRENYTLALINKGLKCYWTGIDKRDWWVKTPYNWGPALHGAAAMAAMTIAYYDYYLARKTLDKVLEHMPTTVNAFQTGGGYSEGPMYQATALGHLTDFVIQYINLTGDDMGILNHQGINDSFDYLNHMIGGDGNVYNFSNCNEDKGQYSSGHMFWWADLKNKPEWAWYAEEFLRPWNHTTQLYYDINAFWFRKAFQPSSKPKIRKLKHFPEIDWVTWKGDNSWLAFSSGLNGGGHFNYDLGHFILGYGEQRFLHDPGYGAASTCQHNTVTVGKGSSSQYHCSRAKIIKCEETDFGMYLVCDLTDAYGNQLEHALRHLWIIDDMHIVVLDDFLASDVMLYTNCKWHWQTKLPVELKEDRAVIKGASKDLQIIPLAKTDGITVESWQYPRGAKNVQEFNRIHWRDYTNEEQSVFPTVLSFGNPKCSWSYDGKNAELKIDERCIQVKIKTAKAEG